MFSGRQQSMSLKSHVKKMPGMRPPSSDPLASTSQPSLPLPLPLSVLPPPPPENFAHGSSGFAASATDADRVGWSTGTGVGTPAERDGAGDARAGVPAEVIGSSGTNARGARPESVAPLLRPENGAGWQKADDRYVSGSEKDGKWGRVTRTNWRCGCRSRRRSLGRVGLVRLMGPTKE